MLGRMRAATRWRRLVEARLAQLEQLSAGRGAVGTEYWNARGRAQRYATAVGETAEHDPLLRLIRRGVSPTSTVIDVGAGTGRFALALAPRVGSVVAVDPSRAMLGVLRRAARQRGVGNIRYVEGRWEDVAGGGDLEPADVVVCSYVLPLIAEAEPFLSAMHQACRGRAFVAMNAMSADALTDPLWRHFHGRPRKPAPTYLDAAAILSDLGVVPEVQVVELRSLVSFPDVRAAARNYREVLALPDTAEVRVELRSLLAPWLVADGGALRPPIRTTPMAIVSWTGGAAHRP